MAAKSIMTDGDFFKDGWVLRDVLQGYFVFGGLTDQTNKSLNSLYINGRRENNPLCIFRDGIFHTFCIRISILRCPIHQSGIYCGPEFGGSNRRIPVFDLAIPSVQRMDEPERTATNPF
jgi:hypothetical protein